MSGVQGYSARRRRSFSNFTVHFLACPCLQEFQRFAYTMGIPCLCCAFPSFKSTTLKGQVMSMQVCLNTRLPSEDNARQANTKNLSRSQRQGAASRQKCSFPKGPCSCIVFTKGPKRFPCSYFRTEVYTI